MNETESRDIDSCEATIRQSIPQNYPIQSGISNIIKSEHSNYIYYNQRAQGTYGSSFLYCASPTKKTEEFTIQILELTHIQVYEIEMWIKNIKTLIATESIPRFIYFMSKTTQASILSRSVFNHTLQIKGLNTETGLEEALVILSKPIARTELCWILINGIFNGMRVVVIEYVSLSYERTGAETTYNYIKWTVHNEYINVQRIAYEIEEEHAFRYEEESQHGEQGQDGDEARHPNEYKEGQPTNRMAASDRPQTTQTYENPAYTANKEYRKNEVLFELGLSSHIDSHSQPTQDTENPELQHLNQLALINNRLKIILNT